MHTQIHNRHTYTQTLRQINYTDIKMNMNNRNETKRNKICQVYSSFFLVGFQCICVIASDAFRCVHYPYKHKCKVECRDANLTMPCLI